MRLFFLVILVVFLILLHLSCKYILYILLSLSLSISFCNNFNFCSYFITQFFYFFLSLVECGGSFSDKSRTIQVYSHFCCTQNSIFFWYGCVRLYFVWLSRVSVWVCVRVFLVFEIKLMVWPAHIFIDERHSQRSIKDFNQWKIHIRLFVHLFCLAQWAN